MAGKPERKQYGLELYRAGVAPILVLSIARFEVSKLSSIRLDGPDTLIALRDKTPPGERHFFWQAEGTGICVEKVALPVWNTYGEVVGLRQYLAQKHIQVRKILVVSTDVHLRRVACTVAKVFGIHIGQAVLFYGGSVEYFHDMVFNYPTLAEAYKVAALNGLNKL
jgi:hypothetical protein